MTQTTRAILLMILAMAGFGLADALIKLAAERVPVAEVLAFVSLGGLVLFGAMTKVRGLPLWTKGFWHSGVLLRNVSEVVGTICMAGALAAAPYVLVVSITQAIPILVTIGAVLILGEKVGLHRWLAILVGLIGVLIILRPDSQIQAGALLAFGAAIGLAMRDVFTRLVPGDVHILQLVTWGMVVLFPTTVLLVLLTGDIVRPHGKDWVFISGAVVLAGIAYIAITQSVRLAEVSVVIPFRYTRLVFGVALGAMIFGENLDMPMFIGSALVVAAGLYILYRERRAPPSPQTSGSVKNR